MTLSEIKKLIEDLVMAKKSGDDDINSPDNEIIKKNIKTLKAQADKNGVSISKLIKMLKSE